MVIFIIFASPYYLSRVKGYSQLLLCEARKWDSFRFLFVQSSDDTQYISFKPPHESSMANFASLATYQLFYCVISEKADLSRFSRTWAPLSIFRLRVAYPVSVTRYWLQKHPVPQINISLFERDIRAQRNIVFKLQTALKEKFNAPKSMYLWEVNGHVLIYWALYFWYP